MYTKRKNSKNSKTERRWQRSILLVNGGHCLGEWLLALSLNDIRLAIMIYHIV